MQELPAACRSQQHACTAMSGQAVWQKCTKGQSRCSATCYTRRLVHGTQHHHQQQPGQLCRVGLRALLHHKRCSWQAAVCIRPVKLASWRACLSSAPASSHDTQLTFSQLRQATAPGHSVYLMGDLLTLYGATQYSNAGQRLVTPDETLGSSKPLAGSVSNISSLLPKLSTPMHPCPPSPPRFNHSTPRDSVGGCAPVL